MTKIINISSKFLFIIFFLFCWLLLSPQPLLATSEFDTSYRINYTIYENGVVAADQEVKLTNLLPNIYATEYAITIGSNNLSEIQAWDEYGSLPTLLRNQENKTEIKLDFGEKVVGKGRSRLFHVVYKSPDFAHLKGQVLEIGVPLLAQSEDLTDYQVGLHVPLIFGKANYLLPNPESVTADNGYRHYWFNKKVLEKSEGITATFGDWQLFNFRYTYHLRHDQGQPTLTQIALPADTPFQQLAYTTLDPRPQNVTVDEDGNWLASYELKKGQKIDVVAAGAAKIFLKPQASLLPPPLTLEQKNLYLQPQPYWEVDNQEIKTLAQKLGSPEAIYNYLVKNFTYDYQRLQDNTQRMGAVWALSHPQNLICMEFTDLFIALTRALGIPAREVNGYAYTTNSKLRPLSLQQDVLHAWPQYYDEAKGLWLSVDPTWGNTTGGLDFFHKLDLDHLAFISRGLASEQPLPVGSYKLADTNGKDVTITFGNEFPEVAQAKITINLAKILRTGLPIKGEVAVANTGSVALYHQPLKLQLTKNSQIIYTSTLTLNTLPPFAHQMIPLLITTPLLGGGGNYLLKLSLANQETNQALLIKPLLDQTSFLIVSGIMGLGLFLLTRQITLFVSHSKIRPSGWREGKGSRQRASR